MRVHHVCAAAAVMSVCVACSVDSAAAPPRDHAASSTTGNYRLIQEPDAGYQPITDMIGAATHSVRLAIYELNNDANVHTIHALFDSAIAALEHGAAATHVA